MTSVPIGRLCALGTAVAASALLAGCVSTVDGTAVSPQGAGPLDVPLLDESDLDRAMLRIGELNAIMGSTQMKVTSEFDEMTDHSDEVSDPDCLGAVYGAEEPVYEGTDWIAVRDQVVREPNDDNDHWVEQTVVLYPGPQNAQDFFDDSAITWQNCADNAIGVGDGDYSWDLDQVEARDTLITQMSTQEGADGWACQHALSLVANVTAEAWACGYSIGDEAAEIVTAMIENVAG
ncbi:sensor domain-containing protein [Mycobacterium sp. Y57]|uniref:sensor domain-containing protein n=1 Tax=Mycolicibacterium xanthum TaxID=2796469 RepID=UPI001C845E5E|nr:sensor domain-containing protein [Mycolicibacterium xanthum]MBX7431485.1 sensor domain-containing protein [Mycolicibacterium xanthum]